MPQHQTGWLAGARDPIVGKSLGLLHSRVAHPWTIADLADEVGISRSGLVERFTRYLSDPPMTYLTRWRLQLAARALESTPRGVAEIAGDVGYESEAAFNRAFKREFGRPPGQYRRDYKGSPAKKAIQPLEQSAAAPRPSTEALRVKQKMAGARSDGAEQAPAEGYRGISWRRFGQSSGNLP